MTVKVKKIMASFGWVALAKYSNAGLGLLTTLILAKLLSPDDFGLVAIASMLIQVLYTFKDMGIAQALIYQKDDIENAASTAFWLMIAFNFAIFLIAVAISPLAADFYNNRLVMPVVILLSSNLMWNAIRAVPNALIRKNIDFHKLIVPEVVPVVVGSIVSISMAYMGYGVWSLVVRSMLVSGLGVILIWFFTPFKPKLIFDVQSAKILFKYGKYIVGSSVFFVALYNIDKFYISKFGGIAMLGFYELAIRIANLPVTEFSHLVGSVMFPVLSRLNQDMEALANSFLKTIEYSSMISMPMAIGISAYGPPLIDCIYGETWRPMAIPLQIVAGYALLRAMSTIIHDTFKACGKPVLMQRFVIFRLILIGILGIPTIQHFGLVGLSSLLVITYFIAFLLEAYVISRLLKFRMRSLTKTILLPFFTSALLIPGSYILLKHFLPMTTLMPILFGIAVSGSCYVIAILTIRPNVVREIRTVILST